MQTTFAKPTMMVNNPALFSTNDRWLSYFWFSSCFSSSSSTVQSPLSLESWSIKIDCQGNSAYMSMWGLTRAGFVGALYLAMLFLAFINSMSVQKPIEYERTVSYRETAAGMYSNMPFALAACTVEVPYILTQASSFYSVSAKVLTGALSYQQVFHGQLFVISATDLWT